MPHTFEVTDHVATRTEHTLAVEVTCAPQTDKTAKRTSPASSSIGIVSIPTGIREGSGDRCGSRTTGPVRIRDLRVLCREATSERAVVVLRANLETVEGRTVHRAIVRGCRRPRAHPAACRGPEPRRVDGHDRPARALVAVVARRAAPPRCRGRSVGRRRVEPSTHRAHRAASSRDEAMDLFGERRRIFLKGSNQGPTRLALADATAAELAGDVRLAKEAGLDLLRVHAHVSRRGVVRRGRRGGPVVVAGHAVAVGLRNAAFANRRSVRRGTRAGARPSSVDRDLVRPQRTDCGQHRTGRTSRHGVAGAALAAQVLPTLEQVDPRPLDQARARTVRRHAARGRPSGVLPHPPQFDGTDAHLYFGWYWGDERDFPRLCASMRASHGS